MFCSSKYMVVSHIWDPNMDPNILYSSLLGPPKRHPNFRNPLDIFLVFSLFFSAWNSGCGMVEPQNPDP